MNKSIIVAVDEKWGIGKNGVLPWHIPEDLKRFKSLTKNSICIMGYNTYKEIADRFNYVETRKFLPFRLSIVITKKFIPHSGNWGDDIEKNGIVLSARSITEALENVSHRTEDIFFIGGAGIFKEAINLVDTFYFTMIYQGLDLNPNNDKFNCDTFFPTENFIQPENIDSETESEWVSHEDGYQYYFKTIKLLKDTI